MGTMELFDAGKIKVRQREVAGLALAPLHLSHRKGAVAVQPEVEEASEEGRRRGEERGRREERNRKDKNKSKSKSKNKNKETPQILPFRLPHW